VQVNCANFSQFRCCKSLGHEELARPSFEFVRAEFFRPFASHLNGEHRPLPHRVRAFAGLVQNSLDGWHDNCLEFNCRANTAKTAGSEIITAGCLLPVLVLLFDFISLLSSHLDALNDIIEALKPFEGLVEQVLKQGS
jgi:hypothetical protein